MNLFVPDARAKRFDRAFLRAEDNRVRIEVEPMDPLATVNFYRGNKRDSYEYTPLTSARSGDTADPSSLVFEDELRVGETVYTVESISHDGAASASYVVLRLARENPLRSFAIAVGADAAALGADGGVPVEPRGADVNVTEYFATVPNGTPAGRRTGHPMRSTRRARTQAPRAPPANGSNSNFVHFARSLT